LRTEELRDFPQPEGCIVLKTYRYLRSRFFFHYNYAEGCLSLSIEVKGGIDLFFERAGPKIEQPIVLRTVGHLT
jgi:hypothetical protein